MDHHEGGVGAIAQNDGAVLTAHRDLISRERHVVFRDRWLEPVYVRRSDQLVPSELALHRHIGPDQRDGVERVAIELVLDHSHHFKRKHNLRRSGAGGRSDAPQQGVQFLGIERKREGDIALRCIHHFHLQQRIALAGHGAGKLDVGDVARRIGNQEHPAWICQSRNGRGDFGWTILNRKQRTFGKPAPDLISALELAGHGELLDFVPLGGGVRTARLHFGHRRTCGHCTSKGVAEGHRRLNEANLMNPLVVELELADADEAQRPELIVARCQIQAGTIRALDEITAIAERDGDLLLGVGECG